MYEDELAFAQTLADRAATIAMDLFADEGLRSGTRPTAPW